jgi:hypothetical protein
MKINESQLRKMIKEALNEIRSKKQPKTGKIQNKEGKWIDATEDGQDKYGNPMYRTKDSSITYGRKCKDGSRRVQDFNFRPNVNESQLRDIIKESIKKVLKENIDNPDNLSLRDFMTHYYDNDETCEEALSKLQDGRYVFGRGWEYVFHEGVGDGVYSPQEGIVAVFDEDDLPDYHSVNFYRFNPQSWLVLRDNENDERDWADTEQYDVEPIDESRLNRVIRESIKKILKK